MPLPGKLTIGFLQEDHPIKAFFRWKPMATFDDEGIVRVEQVAQTFPEDGYIRIVPDKNELSQFKNRMRALGRYCALDLRRFAGENEKIRPNKNYTVGSEKNAFIVYSDVIAPVPSETMVEVLDAGYVFAGEEMTLRAPAPGTPFVLIRREGALSGPWRWRDAPDVAGCITLTRACPPETFVSVPETDCADALLTLSDDLFNVTLLTDIAPFRAALEGCMAEQAAETAAVEPVAEPETIPAPVVEPVAPEAAAQPEKPAADAPVKPAAKTSDKPEPKPESKPEPKPEPKPEFKPEPKPEPKPETKSEPKPRAAAKPEPTPVENPKPWISKTDMPRPRAIAGRLSLREQTMQAQVGINPRKGRSLSEVVDEQWRKSRCDQLGHPVPPEASANPVLSPIERATQAVAEAWALENARKGLIEGLLQDETLRTALAQCLNLCIERGDGYAPNRRLEELEADKLRLMTEIDALRIKRNDMKVSLMDELRKSHIQEFEKFEARSRAMQKEAEQNERAAESAKMAAEAAGQLLQKTSDQIEQQLLGHLMTERAIELVMHMNDKRPAPLQHPALYEPSAGELISDLRVQMDGAGVSLDNDGAVNLLACMLTGGMAIVSGASGSGKSQLVRQLAAALGLTGQANRFVEVHTPDDPAIRELIDRCDALTPAVVLLDDLNLCQSGDAINGVIRLQEGALARGLPLCLMLTVQDAPDGQPLPARLLARAFLLRLDPASREANWKPKALLSASPERAVALSALQEILAPCEDLPSELENRLDTLRAQLDQIGYAIDRRTLNELWKYCSSVCRMSRLSGVSLLDRALAQRAVPAMLASMELDQLTKLPELLCDLPECMKLLEQPLPLPPL